MDLTLRKNGDYFKNIFGGKVDEPNGLDNNAFAFLPV